MLKIVVFLTITACALAAVLPADQLTSLGGRIVGGEEADISSFPWQVSLQKNGMHFCGGIVYSKKIIITAAHCTENVEPSMLLVRAGSANREKGGVLLKVAAFMIHEDYVGRSYDIGLLRLEEELTYSTTIRPIALASQDPENGASAVVTGWGQTYDGEEGRPITLRYVNVNMIDFNLCSSSRYGYSNRIDPSMICAAAHGKDACLDDSGGPLVSGGVVVGIVSYGIGCAVDEYPGIYSNMAVLKKWVEKNVNIV